jgi:hypothetical protein
MGCASKKGKGQGEKLRTKWGTKYEEETRTAKAALRMNSDIKGKNKSEG